MFSKYASSPVMLMLFCSALFFSSCQSTEQIAMQPATVLSRDVFTCKGLSPNNHWIGVTNHFDPEFDTRVVLVANFAPEDLDTRIQYEFINPLDNIVIVESIDQPKNNPLGIYVEIPRLMELGGEGEWTAYVYANTRPIGQAKFTLGEPPEDDGVSSGYFVVGEESLEEDEPDYESQSIDSYIREVEPDLEIPGSSINSVTSTESVLDEDNNQYTPILLEESSSEDLLPIDPEETGSIENSTSDLDIE